MKVPAFTAAILWWLSLISVCWLKNPCRAVRALTLLGPLPSGDPYESPHTGLWRLRGLNKAGEDSNKVAEDGHVMMPEGRAARSHWGALTSAMAVTRSRR